MREPDVDPLELARGLLRQRRLTEPNDATAMALATADAAGRPSVRMVLLKDIDDRGFVFFTNHESRKARDLAQNPRAALCIHWFSAAEQLRVEGRVERVGDAESDAYFATRPRGSQIGAWASDQSKVIAGRGDLDARAEELTRTYTDLPIPRPPHWGGYRIIPNLFEFWQGRADRLHDRFRYRLREANDWVIERLSP